MQKSIFRKKSLERIASPEQLKDYIRVSNPGIWIILSAVILLLIGICAWGLLGRLDTTLDTVAIAADGAMNVYIREDDVSAVKAGQKLSVNGVQYIVSELSAEPVAVNETLGEYAMHVGGLRLGEWVYISRISTDMADGIYKASIVTDSVLPISFVLD